RADPVSPKTLREPGCHLGSRGNRARCPPEPDRSDHIGSVRSGEGGDSVCRGRVRQPVSLAWHGGARRSSPERDGHHGSHSRQSPTEVPAVYLLRIARAFSLLLSAVPAVIMLGCGSSSSASPSATAQP